MTAMMSPILSVLASTHPPKPVTPRKRPRLTATATSERTMEGFVEELQDLLGKPLTAERLAVYSAGLHKEYEDRLKRSDISMLPSYNHTLPAGNETGDCLALDVGGSTFRIALVRLAGRDTTKPMQIRKSHKFEIDANIKRLQGQNFFDWMAGRIQEMVSTISEADVEQDSPLPMGLAWSFPIEQTCSRSGKLLAMGKGFHASTGLEGQDLSEIIVRSCRAKGLDVEMRAIVNDSAATLLSQAYLDSSARMSLILGTGMNSSVFLPVACMASEKFGTRPESWHAAASHVLVNTELSMFGKGIMPVTRWDDQLNANHMRPDFQPMEYLSTGMYLGEIVRLILIEAIETAGLFHSERPDNFSAEYSLSTMTIAAFEADATADLSKASSRFTQLHPLRTKPSRTDLFFIRSVVKLVSHRAQAYLATALYALWSLRARAEGIAAGGTACHLTVACNGTVMERYPDCRKNCQQHLDDICRISGLPAGTISLEMALDSSIYGAAVAVSCVQDT